MLAALQAASIDSGFMVAGGLNSHFMGPDGWHARAHGCARGQSGFGVAFRIGGPGAFKVVTALAPARNRRALCP